MVSNPYARYKQMEVSTTDPVRLVVMLYDGAISAIRRAIEHIERKEYEKKGKELLRAHDIIFELLTSLDHEKGGQVAANLQALYTYMIKRVLEANLTMDTAICRELIGHLETLNESWRTLAKQRGVDPMSLGAAAAAQPEERP